MIQIKTDSDIILKYCNDINLLINSNILLNHFINPENINHTKLFTAIDVIDDCQNAILEFLEAKVSENHSTLYIY